MPSSTNESGNKQISLTDRLIRQRRILQLLLSGRRPECRAGRDGGGGETAVAGVNTEYKFVSAGTVQFRKCLESTEVQAMLSLSELEY